VYCDHDIKVIYGVASITRAADTHVDVGAIRPPQTWG
jgi:hypothetical protein